MFAEPDWQKITTSDIGGLSEWVSVCRHTLSDTVSLSSFSRLFQINVVFCLLLLFLSMCGQLQSLSVCRSTTGHKYKAALRELIRDSVGDHLEKSKTANYVQR